MQPESESITEKENTGPFKKSVLLVEDNQELSSFIKNELEPQLAVRQVFDGEEATKQAQLNLPDIIISDVMMPKLDGIELCKWLRENELTSHIPIILLTARADMESKLIGLKTGADDYLVKPFNTTELKTRVNNLLQQRKQLSEKYKKIIELQPNDIVITSSEEVFIKKLKSVLEHNIDNDEFDVPRLAEELGISRMQLHRKITALTGHSTTSFIRHQRLLHASQLLQAGEPVSQVAYAVGFNSLSYFSKAFKKQFGVLPSAHQSVKI